MQGETRGRWLIVSDPEQIADATAIAGESYAVVSVEQAKNGLAAEIAGKPVVIWPDREYVSRERQYGRELAEFGEVKFIDVSRHFCPTPAEMVAQGWKMGDFVEWVYGRAEHSANIIEVLEPTQVAPELNSEQRDKRAKHREGDSTQPDAAEYPSKTRTINAPSPGFPPESGSPLDSDLPSPDEGAPFEEVPLEAYKTDFQPLSAAEAYIPYTGPEKPSEWPEPLDLTKSLYRGAPLPINLVPAALQPFVADGAKRLGVNNGPVWFGVLGALAGLSSDNIRLQVKQNDNWTVHPSVWCFVLGGPSSAKSPALEIGMRWVQKKDAEKVVENMKKMEDYQHQLNIYEAECAQAVKNKAPRPEKPEMPVLTEYWLNNGTREGAVRMLQHSRKFCYYLDEGSAFITNLDRYSAAGKGSGDREFWLSTWNSGPGKTSLAARTISIPNASAALCGGSTPSAMRAAAAGKLMADGLLARFLICNIPPYKEEGEDTIPDAQAIAMYDRILTNLIDMRHSATLKLSADAASIYREFCEDLTKRIRTEDDNDLTAALGKWYGTWARLALIYQLAEYAANGQMPLDGHQVSGAIAAQVTAFLRWQIPHQQQFYYEIMSNKIGRNFAKTIAKYILAHDDLTVLNFRDHVSRPHYKALEALKPWEIKEAMNTLVNAAWLTPQGNKTNTYGVHNAYDINPRIKGLFELEREQEKERREMTRLELQAMREAKVSED